jgi:O-antigen/teichoic acid export membrane protein
MMIERLIGLLKRGAQSQTVGNALWLGGSSAFNGVLGAVIAALLARTLGVAEYGIYTLVISLIVLLTDVADFGLNSSVIRFGSESIAEGNREKLKAVVAIVTRWKLIAGAGVLLVALLLLNTIVGYVFQHVDEHIEFYFRLSLVGVAFGILAGVFVPIYHAYKSFRPYALIVAARGVSKLILIVVAVALSQAAVSTLIGIEIASILIYLILLYSVAPFKEFSLGIRDHALERQMLGFNKWISLYQALALIGARLDLAFVGGLSDAHALGLYGAASKVSGLMSVAASSYMTVLLPEMSASLSSESFRRKQRNAFAVVGLMAGGILLIMLVADPLVRMLFGSEFSDAGSVLRILCVGLLLTVAAYPINASLFALGRSAVFPLMSAVSVPAFVAGNLLLVPRFGAEGAAMAYTISAGVALLVPASYSFFARKSLRTSFPGERTVEKGKP